MEYGTGGSLVHEGDATTVDLHGLQQALKMTPSGSSPLSGALDQIVPMVEPVARELKAKGQKVAVIVATDGVPDSEPEFLESFSRLQSLPVWMVVRLCTRDPSVVQYR